MKNITRYSNTSIYEDELNLTGNITWNNQSWNDNIWVSVKDRFNYQLYNGKHYFYVTDFNVKQDKVYRFKWRYNIPINYDGSNKWDFMAKLSSDTISTALSSGRYILLDPGWWNASWSSHKKLDINNPKLGHVLELGVHKDNGTDSPSDNRIYCEGLCADNFSDIRFTTIDNSSEFSYWILNYTNGVHAKFYINLSQNVSSIYMYYGNNDTITTSNGNDTFFYFEDFDEYSVGTKLEGGEGGWVKVSGNANDDFTVRDNFGYSGYQGHYNADSESSPNEQFNQTGASFPDNFQVDFDYWELDPTQDSWQVFRIFSNSVNDVLPWIYVDQFYMHDGSGYKSRYNPCYGSTWFNISIICNQSTYGNSYIRLFEHGDDTYKWADRNNTIGKATHFDLAGYRKVHHNDIYYDNIRIRNYSFLRPSWSSFTKNMSIPVVFTDNATSITSTTAILHGNLTDDSDDGSDVFFQIFPITEYPAVKDDGDWIDFKWNFTVPTWAQPFTYYKPPVFADDNGDGIQELYFVITRHGVGDAIGSQFCLNSTDGSIIWMKNHTVAEKIATHNSQVIDVDNDGDLEFIYNRASTIVGVLDCTDGELVYNVSTQVGNQGWIIADLNRTGWPFLISIDNQAGNELAYLYKHNISSDTLLETGTLNHTSDGGVSIMDIDYDGHYELFVSNRGGVPENSTGGMVFDDNLEVDWNYTTLCSSHYIWPIDINDDGNTEVVMVNQSYDFIGGEYHYWDMGTWVFDEDGTVVNGSVDLNFSIHDTGSIADWDDDGRIEMVTNLYKYSQIWDLENWSLDLNCSEDTMWHPGEFANIKNDSGLEYLEVYTDARLYDPVDGYVDWVDIDAYGGVIGDFDGDGYNEWCTYINQSLCLRMFDLDTKACRPKVQNSITYGNERRWNSEIFVPQIGDEHKNDTRLATENTFSGTVDSLLPGIVYKFMAIANNSAGSSHGTWRYFLTKPEVTQHCNLTSNTTRITLNWSVPTSSWKTYIERHTSSVWNRGEGTEIYNGTGSTYNDTGLSNDTDYYYRLWSYDQDLNKSLWQYSSNNKYVTIATEGVIDTSGIMLNVDTMMFLLIVVIALGVIFSKHPVTTSLLAFGTIPLSAYYISTAGFRMDTVFLVIFMTIIFIMGIGKGLSSDERKKRY